MLRGLFLFLFVAAATFGCGGTLVEDNSPPNYEAPEDCGFNIGEYLCDFSYPDQDWQAFSPYDYYGDVMVFDISTMWCGFCFYAADKVQETQDKYQDEGFVYATLLMEDASGNPVEQGDLLTWADGFGISAPVVAIDFDLYDLSGKKGFPLGGYPTFYVVDRDMKIENVILGWDEDLLIGLIEDYL